MSVNTRLLGSPFIFTGLADPKARVYKKTFMQQANVITFIPGKPSYTVGANIAAKQELLDKLQEEDDSSKFAGLFQDRTSTPKLNEDYYKESALQAISGKERDLRFYSFKQDFTSYRKILNVLLTELGNKMLSASVYSVDGFFGSLEENDVAGSISFFGEQNSSVSESASNDVGESQIEQKQKQASSMAKEAAFLMGVADGATDNENFLTKIATIGKDAIDKIAQGSSLVEKAAATIKGENLLFPKVWKGSTFDKSYNLNFRFVSPYGDALSIYENVYMPFMALLAFALPIQTGPDSYKAPLLLRAECLGYFNCDMGMVTSFSFVKGGSEGLWTAAGLPRAIEVNMTITDMYPTLSLATSQRLIRQNIGLSAFVENLAGLSLTNLNALEKLRAYGMGKVLPITQLPDNAISKVRDAYTNISRSLFTSTT
jgi:hypothetical protein